MYRKPLTGFILWLHPVYPRRCQGLPLRGLFCGYQYEAKILFVLGWMQIQGSKLECAWGPPPVRFHHMSSAADAVGAPTKHKNKKKPAIIYSPT